MLRNHVRKYAGFHLGLLVSGVFLLLAVRNVVWSSVWDSWQGASTPLLLLGAVLLVSCWGLGAVGWRLLLWPSPGLRVRDTFACICVGFLANTVLPLRLGELARATLMGRKCGIGISRALGSIVVGRVFDLFTLVGIILMVALAMEIPPPIQAGVATLAVGGLGALMALTILAHQQERVGGLMASMGTFLPRRLVERVASILRNFSSGTSILRRPSHLLVILVLYALGGALAGLTVHTWIRAFHLAVPWYGAFFVLVVVNLGSAIPSSPGYIGVYHYLAVLALSVWVPDRNAALAYAIGTHALNMLANVSLGVIFLTREGVSLRGLQGAIGEKPSGVPAGSP